MMVRKPVNPARGQTTPAVAYPVMPTSPIERRSKPPASPGGVQSQGLAERATENINTPDLADGARGPLEDTMSHELPCSLRMDEEFAGYTTTPLNGGLPPTLQVGSADATPRTSSESQRSNGTAGHISSDRADFTSQPIQRRQRSSSGNPFRRNNDYNGKAPDRPSYGGESSADVWGNGSKADAKDSSAEPWMDFKSSLEKQPSTQLDSGLHLADIRKEPELATNPAPVSNERMRPFQQALHFESQSTGAPEVDLRPSINQHSQPGQMLDSRETLADPSYNVWDDGKETSGSVNHLPLNEPNAQEVTPELPPSLSQPERLPPQPPRPPKTLETSGNAASTTEVQMPRDESVRSNRAGETYQVRLVNWNDASSPTNPRRSPIMVQNANGPCPLLALVNALVLTTRSDITTALVETLRVREQVSLGLLLDAVIDELMSGRRRGSGGILPDVSELYAFLVTLHTGMNVNPRFVPSESPVNLMDAPIDIPTSLHESRKAGGFEDTREMRLYSTFSIPLIHGWIPPRNHPAFAALKRTAETYEDAQNVMFREEELEEKLQRQGLSSEEQLILEDIASVKYFLSSTATQLTGYGLDTVTETLAPGSVAILFRNDHFSTLYRHPKSGQLLTLVTDMGYAGHDEVVWESLVDVSGEGCEFFAGDFRPVGNVAGDTQQQPESNQAEDDSGWTTVGGRSRRGQQTSRSNFNLPALDTLNINDGYSNVVSANTEQEDHDLALAMQLQEEEEERERQESAKRKRDDELSQAYLSSADSQGRRSFQGFGRGSGASGEGPSPPPRGRGSARQAPTKSANDDEDAPPPTYEQAAKGPAYIPPQNHPVHPHASPSPGGTMPRPGPMPATRPRQSSSAYMEHATSYGHSPSYGPSRRGHMPRSSASGTGRGGVCGADGAPGVTRRRSGAPGSAVSLEGDKKDKDCIMM